MSEFIANSEVTGLVINAPHVSSCGCPVADQCLCSAKWYLVPGQEDINYPDDDSDDDNSITTPPMSSTRPTPKIKSMADVDSSLTDNEKRDILPLLGMTFDPEKTPKKDVKIPVKIGWEIPLPVII